MQRYDIVDCDVLVICLVETWLDDSITSDALRIPGFQELQRHDRFPRDSGSINHGGVAMFMKNNVSFTRREDLESVGIESIWCTVASKRGNFLLGSIYRPSPVEFWNDLESHIENAKDKVNLPTLICRDFNNNIRSTSCVSLPCCNDKAFTY